MYGKMIAKNWPDKEINFDEDVSPSYTKHI